MAITPYCNNNSALFLTPWSSAKSKKKKPQSLACMAKTLSKTLCILYKAPLFSLLIHSQISYIPYFSYRYRREKKNQTLLNHTHTFFLNSNRYGLIEVAVSQSERPRLVEGQRAWMTWINQKCDHFALGDHDWRFKIEHLLYAQLCIRTGVSDITKARLSFKSVGLRYLRKITVHSTCNYCIYQHSILVIPIFVCWIMCSFS